MQIAARSTPNPRASCVVVAAGRGRRLGANSNKVLLELHGAPLLVQTLRHLARAPEISELVVVVHPDDRSAVEKSIATERLPRVVIVEGGAERVDSVDCGVRAADAASDILLVHDAARPFVSCALVRRLVLAAREHGAAIPVIAIADTVKRVLEGTVVATLDRNDLGGAQTPQAFRADLLRRALRERARGAPATDEAALVESIGLPVRAIPGDALNFKVTRPADLVLAAALFPRFDADRGSDSPT